MTREMIKTAASIVNKFSGAGCSKLTMLLVNNSLTFQMVILQICSFFLLKNCENPLHCIDTVCLCPINLGRQAYTN